MGSSKIPERANFGWQAQREELFALPLSENWRCANSSLENGVFVHRWFTRGLDECRYIALHILHTHIFPVSRGMWAKSHNNEPLFLPIFSPSNTQELLTSFPGQFSAWNLHKMAISTTQEVRRKKKNGGITNTYPESTCSEICRFRSPFPFREPIIHESCHILQIWIFESVTRCVFPVWEQKCGTGELAMWRSGRTFPDLPFGFISELSFFRWRNWVANLHEHDSPGQM